MSRIVVVGGGMGGLAASALLARAGHGVTLLESASTVGGKSRRIRLDGQQIDTGPSLITFPAVWEELLRRLGAGSGRIADVGALDLQRLPEVGRYHHAGETVSLPVPAGHPWHAAWQRFSDVHAPLADDVTALLLTDPRSRDALPAVRRLLAVYGSRLTTRAYLDSLTWLPAGLREVIAIHTLNAGVSPARTPALYASMPAIMAATGVWVPRGGVFEIVRALQRLAEASGVEVRTGQAVTGIERGRVRTAEREHPADLIVSGLDADRLRALLGRPAPRRPRTLSCSAIAVHGVLRDALPEGVPGHSVVLPRRPAALHRSLAAGDEPADTMAFVEHHRAGEVRTNTRSTVGVLLTGPANAERYTLQHPFVQREIERISTVLGLDAPLTDGMTDAVVLDPHYYGGFGEPHGALYGAARPPWRSGPFHQPSYRDLRAPWLWRVGASVHPGGGIPAVLGGAMIATSRLLARHPA